MIAALMLYSLAVTSLLAIAAYAAEHLLRLSRKPARMVWISAMLVAIGFSAGRFQAGLTTPARTADAPRATSTFDRAAPVNLASTQLVSTDRKPNESALLSRLTPAPIGIASGSAVTRLDRPLVAGWIGLSLLGIIVIGLSALRLSRPRRRWTPMVVDGVPVLVSHDLGPAVVGVLRYRIVLPAWTFDLPADHRDLILAHEREHANAGDPTLLFLATMLVALTPWNAPLWWMARRLRFAIELDCDARVLRGRPDHRAYGSLLLDVSERTLGGSMPIAALAEPVSLIERRIAAMTSRLPRFAFVRGVTAGVMATALIVVACVTPHPASAPDPTVSAATPLPVWPDSLRVQAQVQAAEKPIARQVESIDSLRAMLARETSRVRTLEEDLRQASSVSQSINGSHADVAVARRATADAERYTATISGAGSSSAFVSRDRAEWRAAQATTVASGYGGPAMASAGGQQAIGATVTSTNSGYGVGGGSGQGGGVAVGSVSSTGVGGGGMAATAIAGGQGGVSGIYHRAGSIEARIGNAREKAMQYYPESFAAHDNELHEIVLVFDSTGAVVQAAMKARAPLVNGETIKDREVLKRVLPNASIERFMMWGIANISSAQQQRSSGVVVFYAMLR